MKCEEMMNLMQQSLDQDLTAEEELVMLAHLKQCPGCSDLYVRLKLLHDELAQLPKVKPAYSIVDAILPQLEEIPLWNADSAEGPETSAAAKEQVVAFPPAKARNNRRGLISWKIFSGVAAAGIIIGLFMSNQDNLHMNKTASESAAMQNRMSAPQAASNLGASTGAKGKQDQSAADSATQDLFVVPTQTGAAGTTSAVPPSTPAAAPEGSAEQKDISGRVTMASPTDSSVKDQFGTALRTSTAEDQETASGPSGEAADAYQKQADQSPEAAAGSAVESQPDGTQEEGHLPLAIMEKAGDSAASPEVDQRGGAASLPPVGDAKQMGFTLAGPTAGGAPQPLPSPDGMYTASVAEGKVTITDKDGKAVFVSSIHLGPEVQVRFVEWTDAHTFSYAVKTVSGTETVYVISAVQGKEWKK
ncbi:zf-HC2 domain-containing protein [Paenibacillus mesotrionivorans]|uniref:Zf-HC2 domain-containing protein n=1 Tax=Paenibacillus mesotrionivorans TaxID=3160968 RepID=A0ACC7P137_9BACL